MDNALRSLVRRRAGDVCEYCRLPSIVATKDAFPSRVSDMQHGKAVVKARMSKDH